jgi:hypothetical protein
MNKLPSVNPPPYNIDFLIGPNSIRNWTDEYEINQQKMIEMETNPIVKMVRKIEKIFKGKYE